MDPITVGALIAGGSALVGSVSNWLTGKRQADQSWKNLQAEIAFNREQAQLEREYNFKMWNLTNQYNSPKEQMARLKAAGLNPNMVYGSGSAANTASSVPTMRRANTPNFSQVLPQPVFDPSNILTQYQNFKYTAGKIVGQDLSNSYKELGLPFEEQRLLSKQEYEYQRARKMAKENVISHYKALNAKELYKYQTEAAMENVRKIRESIRGMKLENDLNQLLKPYGLTAKDSALVRQIVRVMAKDNPNMSAVDVALLLPMILPSLGKAAAGVKGLSSVSKAAKAASKSKSTIGRVWNFAK